MKDKPGKIIAVEPASLSEPEVKMEYDENLKPNRPAFKDEKEVFDACSNFWSQNEGRNKRDAWITELYFYKPPYDDRKLKEVGYSWTANVPSGFLAAAVASVNPAFKRALNGTKTLTNATIKGDAAKSAELQSRTSQKIRRYSAWQSLNESTLQERTLLGRAVLRCCDEFDWRPKFYSTQNALFPEGCSMNVDEIPQIVFVDQWSPNDFIDKIKNLKVAKANGWNIENCVKVLNAAHPKGDTDDRTLATWFADGAYAACHTGTGPVYVETYTMLAVEPDAGGKISEWVVGKEHGELLYKKLNKYSKMSDAVALFTFNQGQNTLHSSRGFGRLLAPVHQMYDRALCKLLDDLYLSGMRIVHVQEKRKMDWSIMIRTPFVICPAGTTSEPMHQGIQVEAFYAAIRQFVGLARQIAGAYSPSTILPDEKVEKTATQATIDAAKEGELREGVLGRYSQELSCLIWMMTKRLLNPKTYDQEAKDFQKELIDAGFTREELDEFAACPPTDYIQNYSAAVRSEKILVFCKENRGNQVYDQRKVNYYIAEGSVDPEFAEEIVIPTADPEMDRQAQHDQEVENILILRLAGKITPGPLDNDLLHLQICVRDTMPVVQATPQPTPEQVQGFKNMGEHMAIHIAQAEVKGAKPKELKQFQDFLTELAQQIELYESRMVPTGPAAAGDVSGLDGGQQNALPPAPAAPAPDPSLVSTV
jgi:hypothetical protein